VARVVAFELVFRNGYRKRLAFAGSEKLCLLEAYKLDCGFFDFVLHVLSSVHCADKMTATNNS